MQVTVFQDAIGQGKKSVEVAQKLIKGEKVDSHVWIPFELVTKENMQKYVEKSQ
jgi:inositol transport system substrate-binding protein